MKVHMLFGGFEWEGSRVLAVYADEKVAKEICAKLEQHAGNTPKDEGESYYTSYKQWEAACPLKGAGGFDYYHINSMEVI